MQGRHGLHTKFAGGRVDPFAEDSPIKQLEISHFPPDMFFVLRTVQLLRGLAKGMGVDEFSAASQWCAQHGDHNLCNMLSGLTRRLEPVVTCSICICNLTRALDDTQAALCRGCAEESRKGKTNQPSKVQVEAIRGRSCNTVAATNVRSASVLSGKSALCENAIVLSEPEWSGCPSLVVQSSLCESGSAASGAAVLGSQAISP